MSLSLVDIRFTYSAEADPALDSVMLEVALGELMLIAGETGSGKSTLLRVAAGLLEPDSGVRRLEGVALDGRSAPGAIGLVFQSPEAQLFADTVLDDVAFGPRNLGRSTAQAVSDAAEAIDVVGMDPGAVADRSPFTLSGGQARRVAIAGVLAMKPRYLLFDEPTAGLDAGGRGALAAFIAEARAASGVVVVSHDLDEWLPRADRVLLLRRGRQVFLGTREALLAEPDSFEAAGLVPPAVLDLQLRARRAGLEIAELSLDPDVAADALVSARGARA